MTCSIYVYMELKGVLCLSHSHKLSMKNMAHLPSVLNVVTVFGFVLFYNNTTNPVRLNRKKDQVNSAAVRKRPEDSHGRLWPLVQ